MLTVLFRLLWIALGLVACARLYAIGVPGSIAVWAAMLMLVVGMRWIGSD